MTVVLGLLAILATWTPAQPAMERSAAAPDTLHVLFVGNSFTYYNNMPRMVEAISLRGGRHPIQTYMVATGGASLESNWADTLVQRALHLRKWDWVIVNDQSTFTEMYYVNGQARVHGSSELERNAVHYDSAARAMGARFGIIMHWPDEHAPARDADALAH